MIPALSPAETACASRLLESAGLSSNFTAAPAAGGGNNRVYRLEAGGDAALLKLYYARPDDARDRLGAETAFVEFLNRRGIAAAPQLLAWDRAAGMALFEFIAGRKLHASEVGRSHVQAALDFAREINLHRGSPEAVRLPAASEACFSLAEHCECVATRVRRLSTFDANLAVVGEARRFVAAELAPAWLRIEEALKRHAGDAFVDFAAALPAEQRCLSPSDFGFHNALEEPGGDLRFFDFEYAGWDDPAKLACDFFCQVEIPAPPECRADFFGAWAEIFPQPAENRNRIDWLMPLYQIKWCCILLNEFLPAAARRRAFSGNEVEEGRLEGQLIKAKEMLARL